MTARAITPALVFACVAIACSPVLDWREVRPERANLVALFPCKPTSLVRQPVLAGVAVDVTLYVCSAGGATYAVAFADIGQPQRVGSALDELATTAARNIGSPGPLALGPLHVAGMTPNPRTGRLAMTGQLRDGQRVDEHVAVFAYGTRVYQATIVGPHLEAEAVDTFFAALRLSS
jgi:hypothetical protein